MSKDRYLDRLETVVSLWEDVKQLRDAIQGLPKSPPLSKLMEIMKLHNSITLGLNAADCSIESDYRAHWIAYEDYDKLKKYLKRACEDLNNLM